MTNAPTKRNAGRSIVHRISVNLNAGRAPRTEQVVSRLILADGESLEGVGFAFRAPVPQVILTLSRNATPVLDHDIHLYVPDAFEPGYLSGRSGG